MSNLPNAIVSLVDSEVDKSKLPIEQKDATKEFILNILNFKAEKIIPPHQKKS